MTTKKIPRTPAEYRMTAHAATIGPERRFAIEVVVSLEGKQGAPVPTFSNAIGALGTQLVLVLQKLAMGQVDKKGATGLPILLIKCFFWAITRELAMLASNNNNLDVAISSPSFPDCYVIFNCASDPSTEFQDTIPFASVTLGEEIRPPAMADAHTP